MKKNLLFLTFALVVIAGFFFYTSQNSHRSRASAITSTNLVVNSGFEQKNAQNKPLFWTISADTPDASSQLDTTSPHSGTYALKTVGTNGGSVSIKSDFINVNPHEYYSLSGWLKGSDTTPSLHFTLQQFDSSKKFIQKSVFGLQIASVKPEWKLYSGTIAPLDSRTQYVKVTIQAPQNSSGSIWIDDIEFLALGESLIAQAGCINSATSACLDLGHTNESPSITYNSNVFGDASTEDSTTYRKLQGTKKAQISIPAWDTDATGLPQGPLLLEIRYKDSINDDIGANGITYRHRALVQSQLEYTNPDPLYKQQQYKNYDITHLGGNEDNRWKLAQYVFQSSQFQLIRSINGTFTIYVQMPNLTTADSQLALPIDYITLKSISQEEAKEFKAKIQNVYGYQTIEIPGTKPQDVPAHIKNYNLTTYIADPMQPLLPYSIPPQEQINKSVIKQIAQGGTEDIVVGLYSVNGNEKITTEMSPLTKANSTVTLNVANLKSYLLEFDTKRLNSYLSEKNKYAVSTVADRLTLSTNPITIVPQSSQYAWYTIEIPENTEPGLYSGTIAIKKNNTSLKQIPVRIEVLPVVLRRAAHINPVYNDPYTQVYASDTSKLLAYYKELDVDLFISGIATVSKTNDTYFYDISTLTERIRKYKESGILRNRAIINITSLWKGLYNKMFISSDSMQLYDQLSSAAFQDELSKALTIIDTLGKENGTSFIYAVADEPGKNPEERIIADRLYSFLKTRGYPTTVTYSTDADSSLAIDPTKYTLPSELNQILPPLTNLIDYKVYHMKYQDDGVAKKVQNFGYYTTPYSYLRNPSYNRFAHGLLAYSTNASVVSAYAFGSPVNDPFNDFDAEPFHKYPFNYPDFIFGYPNWNGGITPTLNAVGIRNGIQDARYIDTLNYLIQTKGQTPQTQSALAYLTGLRERINPYFYRDYVQAADEQGFTHKIYQTISKQHSNTDYQAFTTIRSEVIQHINNIVNPTFTPTPIASPTVTPTSTISTPTPTRIVTQAPTATRTPTPRLPTSTPTPILGTTIKIKDTAVANNLITNEYNSDLSCDFGKWCKWQRVPWSTSRLNADGSLSIPTSARAAEYGSCWIHWVRGAKADGSRYRIRATFTSDFPTNGSFLQLQTQNKINYLQTPWYTTGRTTLDETISISDTNQSLVGIKFCSWGTNPTASERVATLKKLSIVKIP